MRPLCPISGTDGFVIVGPLCPRIVCCHEATAAWAAFFARKAQLWVPLSRRGRRGRAAVAVSIKVSCRAWQESSCCCAWNHVENARFGCNESLQVWWCERHPVLCCTQFLMALSAACSELSLVNPGKSLSSDLCPTSSNNLAASFSYTLRMWLILLTPRLLRKRANSVCGA